MGRWHISCMRDFSRPLVYKAHSFHNNCIVQIKCIKVRVAVTDKHPTLAVNQLHTPISKDLGLQSWRKCDFPFLCFSTPPFSWRNASPEVLLSSLCFIAGLVLEHLSPCTSWVPQLKPSSQLKLPRNFTALQLWSVSPSASLLIHSYLGCFLEMEKADQDLFASYCK